MMLEERTRGRPRSGQTTPPLALPVFVILLRGQRVQNEAQVLIR